MHHDYKDIRDRIDEPPLWFDECAVPRYNRFKTGELSNIYANEAALVEIACQSCGAKFHVAFSRSSMDDVIAHRNGREPKTLAASIKEKTIHYGDPPNVDCCAAGATMNSEPLKVLEYWRREKFEWQRDQSLEVAVSDD